MSNGPATLYITGTELLETPGLCDLDTRDEAQLLEADEAAAYASELTYVILGRQFPGIRQARVFPQHKHHHGYGVNGGFNASLGAGEFGLLGALGLVDSCHRYDGIWLHDPVVSIDEVIIGGEVLDPTTYRTRDRCEIVRVDGGLWPRQYPTFDHFSILYTFGAIQPVSVTSAARELAEELWKADHNQKSKLPVGTTSASRQGTSLTVQRDVDAIRSSGPALEKLWHAIAAFNPKGERQPPMLYSPDTPWRLHTFDEPVEGS